MRIIETHTVEYDGGTVAIGVGVDTKTGEEVRFGGDHRPMLALAEAIEEHGPVNAEVEDWAILSRGPAPTQ